MASKKQGTGSKVLELGAGLAAVAAAAGAGYYFYGDKSAKKHRAAASKWAKDMKQQVVREAKKVNNLDQKSLAKIVDAAAAAYATARSVDKNDLTAAARELKKHWKTVKEEVSGAAARAGSAVKKAVSKAPAKKAPAKKAAPKKAALKKVTVKKVAAKKAPAKKAPAKAAEQEREG
jgi:hypothetical protein